MTYCHSQFEITEGDIVLMQVEGGRIMPGRVMGFFRDKVFVELAFNGCVRSMVEPDALVLSLDAMGAWKEAVKPKLEIAEPYPTMQSGPALPGNYPTMRSQ